MNRRRLSLLPLAALALAACSSAATPVPTSALDPEMITEVLDVMRELGASGMTMVVVSHEMGFARQVGSRLVMMDYGAIVEEGEAEAIFTNPTHPRTQEFFSKIL